MKELIKKIDTSLVKFYFLGSNHPKRLSFYLRSLHKLIPFINHPDESPDDRFNEANLLVRELNKNTFLLYVGDSIIEHLSRVSSNKDKKISNTLAYWLGPKTRLGFINQLEFNNTINSIERNLAKLFNLINKPKEIYLIWSSGSIDIRCSFYELITSGAIKNDDELLNIYERNTEHLIVNFLLPLSLKINAKNVIMLSELQSILKATTPSTIKEIKEIRKINNYPTLGTFSQREDWRNAANEITRLLCKKYSLGYVDINSFIQNKDSNLEQFDGVHFSNPETIKKINQAILKSFI